jgi:alpha-1,3-glucan synthase
MHSFVLLLSSYLVFDVQPAQSLRYDPNYEDHNLNTNRAAVHPLDYDGRWDGHKYMPSPSNWRFPFYTLFLDRYVNGNPENDNANGTMFEQDITSTQIRHGGDVQGVIDSLDYIQGMGCKVGCLTIGHLRSELTSERAFTLQDLHLSTNRGSQIHTR